MNKAKHMSSRLKWNKKSVIAIVIAALLLALVIGGTVAYLSHISDTVTNTFTPAKAPTPEIIEEFDKETKQNVQVKLSNNEDEAGPYFIRAAVVFNFQDDEGNVVTTVPTESDYTISYNTTDWVKKTDGYWYYTKETICPGETTTNLINSCTSNSTEYSLVVDIVAQSIQANPTDVASAEWGFVPVTK